MDLLRQCDLEYADDAALLIEQDAREQLRERVGNYDIETETRELRIPWADLLLLNHAGREPTSELPPPCDQIKISNGEKDSGGKYAWRETSEAQ